MGLLQATIRHAIGIHDWVDLFVVEEYEQDKHPFFGPVLVYRTETVCWFCHARDLST